ncbi:MAG TPA: TIGR03435 family protein [Bryobacteraceae bacterium]|nr:TIGR03435 family protein [Bryobacteraceae bacterium]
MRKKTKELPVYGLVISDDGLKLEESDPRVQSNIAAARGRLIVRKISMPNIARVLSLSLERPVRDCTGLTGRYTFRLEWNPEEESASLSHGALASAMQKQLGLRLELQGSAAG